MGKECDGYPQSHRYTYIQYVHASAQNSLYQFQWDRRPKTYAILIRSITDDTQPGTSSNLSVVILCRKYRLYINIILVVR